MTMTSESTTLDPETSPADPAGERNEPFVGVIEPEAAERTELERFWVALRRLPKYVKFAAGLARDRDVPARAKALLALGGAYTISPIDLVPGIIPVAGQLDDLFVLLISLRTAMRLCPREVAADHLERAGLNASDFDTDMQAAKDAALYLAERGFNASRSFAQRGAGRMAALWRNRPRPA
jgi:uncharacterized membrane protein YkvA (DUF1232 family)